MNMKYYKRKSYFLLVALILLISTKVKASEDLYKTIAKQDILCIMLAYPDSVAGLEVSENGFIYIKMKSGNKILYDDKKTKSADQKLNKSDLQDTMEQIYPISFPKGLMANDFDPGRCRNYTLLKEVYGINNAKVQSNLKNVKIGYGTVQFNKSNNAAQELSAVMKELISLSERRVEVKRALFPTSGTFNYRYISGTNRLSPHAFGIAIDLASNKSDYWKWATAKEGERRLLSYPKDLVETFERHNFIWGGKWSHFDILHFEYRPEIILKAKYFGNNSANLKAWYEGAPITDENVNAKINEIDRMIK